MLLKKIERLGFLFGTRVLPQVLEAVGVPSGPAISNVAGYASLWTGMLIGAGVALIGVSLVLGVVSGGAIFAPALLGAILLNGTVGLMAGTVGWGLFRAGEHHLGFSITDSVKQLINFFKTPPQGNSVSGTGRVFPSLKSKTAPLFRMTKHLTGQFKEAVSPAIKSITLDTMISVRNTGNSAKFSG